MRAYLPGQEQISFSLNKYQAYQILDGVNDLTGSIVEANKPISVMAGVEVASVPDGVGADGLLEQLGQVKIKTCFSSGFSKK